MIFENLDRIVFAGDSITDAGRDQEQQPRDVFRLDTLHKIAPSNTVKLLFAYCTATG